MRQIICCKFILKFIFLAGFIFAGLTECVAQNPSVLQTVSPYSRFGIGDFQMNGGMINGGMGGGGIGLRNDSLIPQYINLQNPASFSSNTAVTYEISLLSNTVKLSDNVGSETFNRTTLGNFALAFPVTKWWGAGFGLSPYSTVGYNISSSQTVDGSIPVTYKYEGSGGISQVFLTNSFRPFESGSRNFLLSEKYQKLKDANDTFAIRRKMALRKNVGNISFGIETSYLFGALNDTRRDVFDDQTNQNIWDTKISKETLFHDMYLNYGIQYTFQLRKSLNPLYVGLPDSCVTKTKLFGNKFYYHLHNRSDTAKLFVRTPGIRISFGAVYALPTAIHATYDLLSQTYQQIGTIEQFRDTVLNDAGVPTRVMLPAMGGFGFSLKKDYKWMFQADYMTQLWSEATYNGVSYGLKNSQRATAGFQFQPSQSAKNGTHLLGYLSVIQYRLGVCYYNTAIDLNNTQLTEKSITFSMSLPVPYRPKLVEPISRATLNFEYGIRGTVQNNLIQENFFLVTFGVTINDRWFSHYKYD